MKYLIVFLFLIPFCLVGQTNESDTLKVQASISLTGIFQGGNVQTTIFRATSDVSYKPWRKWVFKTKNSYVYQEFGKQKADEDILSLNFLYFNPEKKVYPLLLGFVSTNFRRQIDIRSLLGAGITWNVLTKGNNWLKLSVSGEYEQTDFDNDQFNLTEYNGSRNINTWRGTVWVNGKYQLFENRLIIRHEGYFQPSLEESNNYRWRVDLGVEIPLSRFLNFKINYLETFESIVVENQLRDDRFLTFGFTIKNY